MIEVIVVLVIMLVVAPAVGWLFFWGGDAKPKVKKK
jgi:type II secretory pathway pseudopilin PulG